ncbi:MAG TPA: hypothetical protein VKB76_10280 [Ktedonobacterales bacterium]|nr:hypothetical protein [Ktedonobacterales bacterium]
MTAMSEKVFVIDDKDLMDRAEQFLQVLIDDGLTTIGQLQVIELMMVMQALRARDQALAIKMIDAMHKHARQLLKQNWER